MFEFYNSCLKQKTKVVAILKPRTNPLDRNTTTDLLVFSIKMLKDYCSFEETPNVNQSSSQNRPVSTNWNCCTSQILSLT